MHVLPPGTGWATGQSLRSGSKLGPDVQLLKKTREMNEPVQPILPHALPIEISMADDIPP